MPILVTIAGPIAAGKNTVADLLAEHCVSSGRTVVIADVDDAAAMVAGPGAGAVGLWFAAHQAHGALVGQWMNRDTRPAEAGPVRVRYGRRAPARPPSRVLTPRRTGSIVAGWQSQQWCLHASLRSLQRSWATIF